MRVAAASVVLMLVAAASVPATDSLLAQPPLESPAPSPSPVASASPSPSPGFRYKLLPYGFETPEQRSTVPLLRFEDKTEVRALEMNAAIARFFEKGSMLRGATPGGAPTLRDMAPYRPHVTQGADFLGAAVLAAKHLREAMENRKKMAPAAPSPSPSPNPLPSP